MIVVMGCGNPNRSDDGVGPEVIRRLAACEIAKNHRLLLRDAGTDGIGVLSSISGCQALIIVDACRSGRPPGSIFEVPGVELERSYEGSLTLHDFRWDHALHAGRRMLGRHFPCEVMVFLIEAASIDFGTVLSPSVSAAADKVVQRIERVVSTWVSQRDFGVLIRSGSIHLSKETFDECLSGLESVALQRRGSDLLIIPIRGPGAGGYLLKHRNARGDRVLSAAEFLRTQGLDDSLAVTPIVSWDSSAAALVLQRVFDNGLHRP